MAPEPYPTLLECGVASRPVPGEELCGDAHVIKSFPGGVLVGVVDGLGHGRQASAVAARAVATLEENAHEPVDSLMDRCHDTLHATRGAAMTIASLRFTDSTLSWLGVGNVEGVVIRGSNDRGGRRARVTLAGGVVGYRLPPPRIRSLEVGHGDVLILATDGIDEAFADLPLPECPAQQAAERILERFARDSDDALVLFARYAGAGPLRGDAAR